LLGLADIIKYDFQNPDSLEARWKAARYVSRSVELLAEKVETAEEFAVARRLGFTMFQGRFFARPQVMRARQSSTVHRGAVRLLAELSRPEPDISVLEAALRLEPGLSAKLLRYLNSAGLGLANRVGSLRQAIVLLGHNGLRRWGAVAVVGHLTGSEAMEAARVCLTRGRCCELIGRLLPPIPSVAMETDLFLAGLLSGLPGLVGEPIEQVLATLAVADELFAAVVSGSGQSGTVCLAAVACESAEWQVLEMMARSLGVTAESAAAAHAEAMVWADEVLAEAG